MPARPNSGSSTDPSERPYAVALAGMAALAAAMGIGRFAFTPLLPMMLADGVVTLDGGSWLATANYVGYLLGALGCMALAWLGVRARERWHTARLARWGLAATVVLTLGMALPFASTWPVLRFAAGVASALVFLNISSWCMLRLLALGRPALGGFIFCGPGLGIMLTGLSASAMVGWHWPAAAGWAVFGLLSLALCAMVWPVVRGQPLQGPAADAARSVVLLPGSGWAQGGLTLAYGLAGLGYIVTATFLPVIAREALPSDSPWPDLFWPLFGAGVAMGAALTTRTPTAWDRRWLLLVAYLVQAAAIGLTLLWPGATGFALGSWMLGLPFTAITFYALQEARRIAPVAGDRMAGLLTAAYGAGQIVGPPMVAWALRGAASPSEGFHQALTAAAASLLLGAGVYAAMALRWPLQSAAR